MDKDIIKSIRVSYSKSDKLIVGLDAFSNLHVAMYTGQGSYDSRPIERFVDEIRDTVRQLYKAGQLIPDGTTLSSHGTVVLKRLKHIED
ncbi:hypothetical protein P4S73_25065 [Paraglaciecola sp. Hal342]|jgi:hypothetical protein|uniref:Transposase n=1 Tax=Paraglaciecola chathamensis TaxID=368405 RepID=A0ABS0WG50_9ALTE|nr:hypothetical protein [Paraglaciecola chathamensis]MBJ2137446.1 hypothetical protein [Paraglaciecola chathamensis]|tara:strand:- start:1585 stop:1851 length:267 start_codon:yes stop_codon:yes gene_type:complete